MPHNTESDPRKQAILTLRILRHNSKIYMYDISKLGPRVARKNHHVNDIFKIYESKLDNVEDTDPN